jgi:hypothetical protein
MKNREKFFEWLQQHPCIDCGETDILVLELDHIRGKESRKDAISLLVCTNRRWEFILKKIADCVVRCANCHRRKTAKQLGWYKWKRTQPNFLLASDQKNQSPTKELS